MDIHLPEVLTTSYYHLQVLPNSYRRVQGLCNHPPRDESKASDRSDRVNRRLLIQDLIHPPHVLPVAVLAMDETRAVRWRSAIHGGG